MDVLSFGDILFLLINIPKGLNEVTDWNIKDLSMKVLYIVYKMKLHTNWGVFIKDLTSSAQVITLRTLVGIVYNERNKSMKHKVHIIYVVMQNVLRNECLVSMQRGILDSVSK